jgi:cytochrome c oxidase cbb3-type subunit III
VVEFQLPRAEVWQNGQQPTTMFSHSIRCIMVVPGMRKYMMIIALATGLPVTAQHVEEAKASKNPAIGNPDAIAKGAKLYAGSCAGCHGPDGSGGRGPNLVRRAAWHALTDEGTFDTIRNGVPGADMPATKLTDEQTWELVAFVKALTGPAAESTVEGDPVAGGKVYWSAKAGCSNCHAIRGRGSRMGPDLSNVGGTQPLTLIRESILQPSKDPSLRGKESVTITLRDGKVINGVARNRSKYAVQLIDTKGELHLLSASEIKEIKVMEHSGMPDDYRKRLTREELQNLLAYLARQTSRPADATTSTSTYQK